ncbi:MAG: VWA domain-containing protein [Nanoarchaeota archaeon]|nr:VWA domain-containing protein [Nanoarchaeota archaeon]
MEITFSDPMFLWFLLGIPLLVFIHFQSLNRIRRRALKFANFEAISNIIGERQALSKNFFLLLLRCLALVLVTLAISGMAIWYVGYGSDTDYVLAIDTSNSMTIDDLTPDRVGAAKEAAMEFVDVAPPNSYFGVVVFSGSPIVKQKLTDKRINVKKEIEDIFVSVTGGTNIGDAIITSVSVLSPSNNSKAVILLTDGQTNIGPPIEEAIAYANENGVIVHTIGVGTEEGGILEGTSIVLGLDEQELVKIAMETSGQYFRAISKESLKYSYSEISRLDEQKIRKDLSFIFVLVVFVILLFEWFLINTKYRTIP